MTQSFSDQRNWAIRIRLILLGGVAALVLFTLSGCTYPGGLATSTVPIPKEYLEIGGQQESSSCGYAFLMLPLGNPRPMADIIDEMIKAEGGDALINVSSDSTSTFFILGSANCVNIRGTVVKFG